MFTVLSTHPSRRVRPTVRVRPGWASTTGAADAFGNALGNSIVGQISQASQQAEKVRAAATAKERAEIMALFEGGPNVTQPSTYSGGQAWAADVAARRADSKARQIDEFLAQVGTGGASVDTTPGRTVTVKSGQTLSGIVGTNNLDTLNRIAAYNGLPSAHEVPAGFDLRIPGADVLAGVDVSQGLAQRTSQGAAYYAQRQADIKAQSAQQATQTSLAVGNSQDVFVCTPSNPYGLSQAQTAVWISNMVKSGSYAPSTPRPGLLQSTVGALEVSASGLWNTFGANTLAGVNGVVSSVLNWDTNAGVNAIRNTQSVLTWTPSTEGGQYHASWLANSSFVQGIEGVKTNTGNHWNDRFGPVGGAAGYSALDALLLSPMVPKVGTAFKSVLTDTASVFPRFSSGGLSVGGQYELGAVNFGDLLRKAAGAPPEGMPDPHAHHVLFKEGNGAGQKALVAQGQALLRSYNIDPIMGAENLVWAPNRIAGQHSISTLRDVVQSLNKTHEFYGTREAMVTTLEELGRKAAQRR